MSLTDEQITALIRRHRTLGGEMAEIQAEMISIKEQVDSEVGFGWKLTVDGLTASKREANREFDKVLAFGELTPEELALCKVERYDDKLIREMIEKKGALEACMTRKPDAKPVTKL